MIVIIAVVMTRKISTDPGSFHGFALNEGLTELADQVVLNVDRDVNVIDQRLSSTFTFTIYALESLTICW